MAGTQLIQAEERNPNGPLKLDEYEKPLITPLDWAKDTFSNPLEKVKDYGLSLFPIHKWILHYNLSWLYADVVAGITVGIVLVPQSMSYAQIATLPSEYGLYSAFIGVMIYCLFATSKDVSIGPVAVMSLEMAKVIARVQKKDPTLAAPIIATCITLICGGISLGIGLLRLGFILEFISVPAVMGFMSGSAFSIIAGQVPALMGYNKLVNSREATYHVVINSLKHLPDTKLDAVFGLIPLLILYVWKWSCDYVPKRYPKSRVWCFFLQALRNGVVIVLFTVISWAITRHRPKGHKAPISILGTVPSGLRHVGVMTFPDNVMSSIGPELPAATIVLLLEHIAISKSFGRINDYKIVPDQELIAIGVTNLIGTFFNAYPATGSFSRSALKAKCNVKTPLAGIFTGGCVILALYCLTSAFYYIPKATLSAVIIHAVSDLIAQYTVPLFMYKVAPIDCGIFIICVFITVFSSIENGIYFAICASCANLLFHIAMPTGMFLGRVQVAEVIDPVIASASDGVSSHESVEIEKIDIDNSRDKKLGSSSSGSIAVAGGHVLSTGEAETNYGKTQRGFTPHIKYHTKWVPISKKSAINSTVKVQPPPPGVKVFRLNESFNYINSSRQYDMIFDEVTATTKRGVEKHSLKDIDRPWNDPGKLKLPWKKAAEGEEEQVHVDERPLLRILVLDFSQCTQVDATSMQCLIDLKKALNKYTDHEVEFHFVGILDEWVKRALVNIGFGVDNEFVGSELRSFEVVKDEEDGERGYQALIGTNTPYFHVDFPNFDYLDQSAGNSI
ncbi:hypothetical protein WICPIJ_002511 [Wickerhamomyces pijperi]|uniref:STAS domain-containing protein n=1 Tax=Wickerhamomyces pijperi TaxID=599730 RepID=A0A9P8Q911_WICPI|nr:hypothetical protein WICPIJ_002511 [Wickerhamomyces pijperi]